MGPLRRHDLALILGIAVIARLAAAWWVDYASYTDPSYYTLVAERLATGHGFTVPVIWSFLEVGARLPDPAVLPVPSNGHWMPLTSIVAAGPMTLLGASYRAAQIPSILLSIALVPMTALLGSWLFRRRWVAIVSAVLATFAGPLLIYYPTVDNFALFGILGAGALGAAMRATVVEGGGRWLVLSGALCGLATLARVDGVLLTIAPAAAWLVRGEFRRGTGWLTGCASAAAFLLVLAPWLIRNVIVFDTPLPSAGANTLWITSYNEQFSIAGDVSLSTYLASGPGAVIGSKLASWGQLLGRTANLFGGMFLLAFLPGLWFARRRPELRPFLAYFVLMFVAMGGLFTFHAPHGAFYHSAPAWLPFAIPIAVAAVPAVATATGRFWPFLRRPQTHRFLVVVGTLGAIVLSLLGSAAILRDWERSHRLEVAAAAWFAERGATEDVVMYGDPASLHLVSGNPGVAAPFDDYPVIEDVIRAYEVDWVMVMRAEGATTDALDLWNGANGRDRAGNSATFLPMEPAYEIDGLRIYPVLDP